ncbi:MAG: DEAD/DEAH box helicase [Planctomycetota bacterium]
MSALDLFQPRIREWFAGRFEAPTDIQTRAWPRISAGDHVLATAPTGSGKTLAAFLWALDQLLTGAWGRGATRVLYVSPLKALNNDVRRNLLQPLAELRERFGGQLAEINVQVRSGDTPQAERRRMLRHPPEILVTTPESLNLLLSSHGGRRILTGVRTVILDEIHAVAGNKRGTYLMTAVERLAALAGEFQRLALSATVRPLDTVAQFVGGTGRKVAIVESAAEKRLEVSVCGVARDDDPSIWPALVKRFREIIDRNRSTLLFVNSRAAAEKLVRWLNEGEATPLAYAHHGSLSRELRTLVEHKLKRGELKALVATSSLELGIDIGSLDEVILVQAPRTANSALQRIGRGGHGVGEVSRGRLYPLFGRDFVDAAVLAPLLEEKAGEAVRPVQGPLDVLAQVIVAMCGVEEWELDALFALLRRSWPYRDLKREAFDRVIAMLRGRYADTRLRELRPRLRMDPETGRVRGAAGVLPLVYRSGGVIPDRGYYTVRVQGSGARLGELDEEFVWERVVGHEFTIGAQTWRIERITRNDVEVVPGTLPPSLSPFWKAEKQDRDFFLCEHIGRWLEAAEAGGDEIALPNFDEQAGDALRALLRAQREATLAPLPHRHHLLIERSRGEGENRPAILHALWGGRILRPYAMALAGGWEQAYGYPLEVFAGDDCVLVQLPKEIPARELLDLVTPDNVEPLLRARLENTGFFGTRFRENAARALLLPRRRGGVRTPLWLSRLRAQKLLAAVRRYDDFPVLAETWRTCLEDEFDLDGLRARLEEVQSGAIEVTETTTTHPSPFAGGITWRSTEQYLYDRNERPEAAGAPSLSEEALREVLHDAALRPRLDPALVAAFVAKLRRTAPGYEPRDGAEWLDHAEEQMLVAPPAEVPPGLEVVPWGRGWMVSTALRPRLERARAGDDHALAECVAQFLQSHGPVTLAYVREAFEVPAARAERALGSLVADGRLLADRFLETATGTEFCDTENLERLLRLTRAAARPQLTARPKEELAGFLALQQGLVRRGESVDHLRDALEMLFGYAAPAALWEEAILPARLRPYLPAWLDALMQESDLTWYGAGPEQAAFAFTDDVRLFLAPGEGGADLLPDALGRYDFFDLQRASGLDSAALARRLWEMTWDGRLTNDTFAALRKGIENGFQPAAPASRRRVFRSWQSSRPLVGHWQALAPEPAADRLEEIEDQKERVRQLLARYGVVCRALLAHEPAPLRWGRIQKALRLMELGGEVVGGAFFLGIEGLQFAAPAAVRRLRSGWSIDDQVYWLNACDPASLCGTGLQDGLPPRLPSTWLVYRGAELVLVARRGGREVECRQPPRPEWLQLFPELLARGFRAPSRIVVEDIDGEAAAASAHAGVFEEAGFRRDMRTLVLERSYA